MLPLIYFQDRDAFLLDLSFLPSFHHSIMPPSLAVSPIQIISMIMDFPSVSYLSVSLMCFGILVAVSFMAHRNAVGVIGFGYGFLHKRAILIHLSESLSVVEGVRRRKYDCMSCVTDWEGSI